MIIKGDLTGINLKTLLASHRAGKGSSVTGLEEMESEDVQYYPTTVGYIKNAVLVKLAIAKFGDSKEAENKRKEWRASFAVITLGKAKEILPNHYAAILAVAPEAVETHAVVAKY